MKHTTILLTALLLTPLDGSEFPTFAKRPMAGFQLEALFAK